MKKNGFFKGALVGALVMLLVVTGVACGLNAGGADISGAVKKKLELLQGYVGQEYKGKVSQKELAEGVYKGYISGLNDPYSVYYTKTETKQLMEQTSGEYSGIGAVLTQDATTGVITILQVYDQSPAAEAGLKAGDILYKVGDRELKGTDDLAEIVTHIKGEEGTKVKLSVLRGAANEEVQVTATRRKVEAETVAHEMKADKVGYLQIKEFDEVTLDQYRAALTDLEKLGMERLVVDLRDNPGGNLQTVSSILDLMLPKGLTVYMEDKAGKRTELKSDDEHQFNKPLVVLVNGNSASASEIYAGAIQDYGTGKILGTQSYGKGVVQQIFDLKDDTSVKLTIAEYYTPKGRSINKKGITPDKVVEFKRDDRSPAADNQLDEALNYVKTLK